MESEYINTRTACKLLGVHAETLRRWDKAGKVETIRTSSGRRLYKRISLVPDKEHQINYCYCRVSSVKQKNDLERQVEYMKKSFPEHTIITDIGSGLNYKRNGIRTILGFSMRHLLGEIVVAHKDRLCRIGYDLIQWIVEHNGGKSVVLDKSCEEPTKELTEDLISIITVFGAKLNGRRRYANKKSEIEPEQTTEKDD